MANKSLKDRILSARSEASIEKLLKEGAKYEFATQRTRRRWKEAAQKRTMKILSDA
jgi:hypothetical protein